MRKLFLAPFGAHDAGERLLGAALATGVEPQEILYVCPSPRKLRDVQVRFARAVDKDAFVPPRFRTLPELARDLHNDSGRARRFRSELKPLLVQSLLERRHPRPRSQAAAGSSPSIGYCAAVAGFISDLKLGVDISNIEVVTQTVADLLDPYEKPKARALEALDILKSYDAALREKGWADDEDVLAQAPGRVANRDPLRLLVLDSFVAPNRLEQQLIAALVGRAEKTLALCYGSVEDEPAYRLGREFIRFLKEQSFSVSAVKSAPTRPEPPLFCFNSPEDEVTVIARHIKQEYLAGRLDVAKTVVAFPALGEMAPLADRTFREYGVPATVYPAQGLAASPPVVAVLELLAALESGYERIATSAAFSSEFLPGLLRLGSDASVEPRAAAAAALYRAGCEAGIVKGADAWKHLAERLEPEYGFEDDEEQEFAEGLEKRVRQAIGLTEKLMSGQTTLGGFAGRLKQLLEAADFCRDLKPDERKAQLLLEDRGELYDILDSLVGFEQDFGARPADLTGFIKAASYLVGLAQRVPDHAPQGVLVLSLSETLGLAPEHLYVGGLTESNLPSRYPVDPLLPDTVRRKLGLPDIDWHRDHERFHFERTRNCSRESPWLSYHAAADAKVVLPTPFLDAEPVSIEPAAGLFSPEEEQRYEGAAAGRTLDQTGRPVDFARDKDALAALGRSFGPDRKLSITSLERYRRCPYCFYVGDILGLEPLDLPTLEIEPQKWGIMVHRALARLYRDGPVPTDKLRQRSLESLDEVMAEFGLNRFWEDVTRRLFENSIDDIVECEERLRAEGFLPVRTEARVIGAVAPDVLLRGRIDRYDSNSRRLRVLDYKTGGSGAAGATEVTDDRTHLQLPIYSHLIASGNEGTSIDNMGIYSTREARVHWMADEDHPVDVLVRAAIENAVDIARSIRAGEFPSHPADPRTCDGCTNAFICGRIEPAEGET